VQTVLAAEEETLVFTSFVRFHFVFASTLVGIGKGTGRRQVWNLAGGEREAEELIRSWKEAVWGEKTFFFSFFRNTRYSTQGMSWVSVLLLLVEERKVVKVVQVDKIVVEKVAHRVQDHVGPVLDLPGVRVPLTNVDAGDVERLEAVEVLQDGFAAQLGRTRARDHQRL